MWGILFSSMRSRKAFSWLLQYSPYTENLSLCQIEKKKNHTIGMTDIISFCRLLIMTRQVYCQLLWSPYCFSNTCTQRTQRLKTDTFEKLLFMSRFSKCKLIHWPLEILYSRLSYIIHVASIRPAMHRHHEGRN